MERKLAAIFAADAVGYSRLMSISELETYALVKADLTQIFAVEISSAGGRLIKTTGDGLLAEFPSAVGAVNCAVEAQRTVATGRTKGLDGSGLSYRIGINVGEIIAEPGDIYGDAVNVAVRLQQMAEPGAIAVSAPVRRALGHRADLYIEDLGECRVKNLGDTIRVYRIQIPRSSRHGDMVHRSSGCRPNGSAKAAVVISPFRSIGTDQTDHELADGITATLTNQLAGCRDLTVVPFASKHGHGGAIRQAEALDEPSPPCLVLEGSVHLVGKRARITVQLADIAGGRYLWAERFDLRLDDPLGLESDLAILITDRLARHAGCGTIVAPRSALVGGGEADVCAQRGHDLMIDFDPKANNRAKACFEAAIEFDPRLCGAYTGLANAYWRDAQYCWAAAPEDALRSALELARTAVALDPSDPWAHAVLAAAKLTSGLLNAAILEFHTALRIEPSHAGSLAFLSEALVAAGRPVEAIGCVEKALRFTATAPDWYHWNLGLACYASGHYDRAIAALRRIDHLTEPRRLLAASLAQNGNLDAARREATDFLATNPNFSITAWIRSQAFMNDSDAGHFEQGYRHAGLPK